MLFTGNTVAPMGFTDIETIHITDPNKFHSSQCNVYSNLDAEGKPADSIYEHCFPTWLVPLIWSSFPRFKIVQGVVHISQELWRWWHATWAHLWSVCECLCSLSVAVLPPRAEHVTVRESTLCWMQKTNKPIQTRTAVCQCYDTDTWVGKLTLLTDVRLVD